MLAHAPRVTKTIEIVGVSLGAFGTICWGICFWWMHRISQRQEAMLCELRDVTKRIEELSEAEHELLREVHPAVQKIEHSVKEVAVAVEAEEPRDAGRR